MRYAPEPVPVDVDPELAEFLYRQLIAIAQASDTQFVAPLVYEKPESVRPVIGGIIYVYGDGFYGCVEDENTQGAGIWKKLAIQQ